MRYEFGRLYLEGFIHGGAYFRNFTVLICPYLSVLTLNGNNGVLWLVSHIFLLAEVSHDEAKMRERRETLSLSLSFLSFLPRHEKALLSGKVTCAVDSTF